jgi:alpha-L-fucosidase 2
MKRVTRIAQVLAILMFCLHGALAADPGSAWSFNFKGPLPRWKDGLPIGNGRIGAQSWGAGPQLFLTLDRSDVWDLRYQPNQDARFNYGHLRELVRQRRRDLIQQDLSPDVTPTADQTPYHLAIGRLRIDLPERTTVERTDLDMRRAEVRWSLRINGKPAVFRAFACATENVIVLTLEGLGNYKPKVSLQELPAIQEELARKLGYQKATHGEEGNYAWVVQPIPDSGKVATAWRTSARPDAWQLLLTITPQDDSDPLASARRTLDKAQHLGVAGLRAEHRAWWKERWERSSVLLPDAELQRLWINGIYKLASSSRLSVPTNLQGLWPPDGEYPPWRGDYHCDMNVQQTYWAAYTSNQLDLAEPLNRWLLETVGPKAEILTKRFFGVDGLWMGTAYDARGRLLGGKSNWLTAQYWLGGGGWMSQYLWWYYRYSMDEQFLRSSAYPFMKKCLWFYENILEKGQDGRLHIPLSYSPEYFSNDLEGWTQDPTCDLSIIRNLAQYTIAAAKVLHVDEADQARWQALVGEMGSRPADSSRVGKQAAVESPASGSLAAYPVSARYGLEVQPNVEYDRSHRHPMHLFPIFPGEDLTIEGSAADRALINRTIHNWILRGTGEWTGWSYPYGSLVASRVRRSNQALNLLQIYAKAFIWPNGFHVNGDYKRYGFSSYDYQPFTVEAECGFTAAVNEMLLQSWGERLRIFPSVPDDWKDVSFDNLRAQGGVIVSAEMRQGKITSAAITSEKGGDVRVVWPLGYVAPDQAVEERVFRLAAGERRQLIP